MAEESPPSDPAPGRFQRFLNEDGERHPVENALAFLAVGLGIASVVLLVLERYDGSAWTGLAGALIATYDEFLSKTSGERRLILVGFVLCLVGIAVSMAHGAIF